MNITYDLFPLSHSIKRPMLQDHTFRDGPIPHFCRYADMPILAETADTDTTSFCLPIPILLILKKVPICRYFRYRYWYRPNPTYLYLISYNISHPDTKIIFMFFFYFLGQNQHFWKYFWFFFLWECDLQFITLQALCQLCHITLLAVKKVWSTYLQNELSMPLHIQVYKLFMNVM